LWFRGSVITRTAASAIALSVVCLLCVVAWQAQPLALHAIHGYQRALSPAAARIGLRCRFTPSCSRYAEAVIRRDGVVRGGWRAAKRVARCGPWTAYGTRDEP
jgi:putative membrane protein insertion efficiency factor